MGLVRDLPMTLPAMVDTIFVTCAGIVSTAGSTSAVFNGNTTADALVAPTAGTLTTGFGLVIDRMAAPLGTVYSIACPAAHFKATVGSTETDRKVTLGVKLQHGDSSGGGDMVDYSTGSQPDDRNYFGTARTCDMLNWEFSGRSTGALYASSNPAYYDIRAAKRYIRVAVRVGKDKVTTETSGDERARVSATVSMLAGANIPQTADVKSSPFSTSTSTS